MDSNGLGMPMGATSSAVWAPGKQSHRSCHCWVCLAQQSLCCVTEGSARGTSHHSSTSRPTASPSSTGKQAEVGSGAHTTVCCTEQGGTGEPPWGHTSEHRQPLCVTTDPGVQTAHSEATCLGTLETQAKEAGAGTVLALMLQVAEFDAIPMSGVAQLAPGTYTPALAGLCPWPGRLPWHRARSRHQLPTANLAPCPVPAVLPCRTPAIPAPRAAGTG